MSVSEKIHVNLYITGRVTSPYFIQSLQRVAEGLGISGYMYINEDKSVMVEAEGAPVDVQQLFEWCQEGTSASSIKRVDLEYGSIQHLTGFEVR